MVALKPKAVMEAGFVFVSINHGVVSNNAIDGPTQVQTRPESGDGRDPALALVGSTQGSLRRSSTLG